jgi:SAM-dependent methyltransferase
MAKSPGTILDVGCGTGHFLAAMRKYSNWELIGIDRDPQVIAFVRDALNVETYVGRIEESNFPDHTFDAVTMWDSLEHFHYPRRALLKIQRILKPTGILLLRVPSLDSLDARLFGRCWSGLDAPRHLTVFSQETLCRLLRETGFSIKRLWCMSGSHASFTISLHFSLENRNSATVLGDLLQRAIASPIVSVLSAPYFFILDKLLLGPEITVLAKKARRD